MRSHNLFLTIIGCLLKFSVLLLFFFGRIWNNNAPYIFLASNDKRISRNGDEVDVAPTVCYGFGLNTASFNPALDRYPLQIALPEGVEAARQAILSDNTAANKPTLTVGGNESTKLISFSAVDRNLVAVYLLLDNSLIADGPWTWYRGSAGNMNAYGSFTLSTEGLSAGDHTVKVLAFDEHGANNNPATTAVNFTISAPSTPTQPYLYASTTQSTHITNPSITPTANPSPSAEPNPSTEPTASPLQQSATIDMHVIATLGVIALAVVAIVVAAKTRGRLTHKATSN